MLTLATHAEEMRPEDAVPEHLEALTRALEHECRLVEDLRRALLRQREGIAADDREMVEASVHAMCRTILVLEEARRGRIALTELLGGPVPPADLEHTLAAVLPPSFRAARAALRAAAQATAREVATNQNCLRLTLQADDAFLQQLFSSLTDPMPVYGTGAAAAPLPDRTPDTFDVRTPARRGEAP